MTKQCGEVCFLFGAAGAGNDIVIAGGDNVARYEGDDYIIGGAGDDVLLGDAFVMGAGADYSTTPNIDLYSAKLLVNDYSIDTSQHGRDMIDGGSGNDQIEGDGKDDLLFGGEGNDLIFGDDSAALIQGDAAGNDVIDGGSTVVSTNTAIKKIVMCEGFTWATGRFNQIMQAANSTNWRVAA